MAAKPTTKDQHLPSASKAKRGIAKVPKAIAKKRVVKSELTSAQTDPAVIAFMEALSHPLKHEIEAIRQIILGVSPEIQEGIKWNSPSFRTTEYFATVNLRADRVWLILHLGAKVKDNATNGIRIADPAGHLEWLATDRCVVKFDAEKSVQSNRAALADIIGEWIKQL